MSESIVEIVDGSVYVRNVKLVELLEQQNTLLKHQNTILSKLVDVLMDMNNKTG